MNKTAEDDVITSRRGVEIEPSGGAGSGFESAGAHSCDVWGHRSHVSRDILPRSSLSERLIAAARIEGELAEQFPVLVHDPNIGQPTYVAVVLTAPSPGWML